MASNQKDSGVGTEYTAFTGDDTQPAKQRQENSVLSDYLLRKLDSNIENIKENVHEINHKVSIDQRMIISDISIGIISSLIVSIVFLFTTTNIGQTNINIFGMNLPVFLLFIVCNILIAISTYYISKRNFLRNSKN